ncbi:hypothetical protein [Arthrobacter sp. KK5.5]|uniref:hypothetical protein n=1 Tax=Arthrobacter sp. KK5.5 TaxID=3373084 RepID=UPI003EE47816
MTTIRAVPADTGRAIGLAAIPAAWTLAGPVAASVMFLVFGGQWALRYYARGTAEDVFGQAVLLCSGWLSVVGAYAAGPALDLMAHFAATAVLTSLAWDMLRHHGLVSGAPSGRPRLRAGAVLAGTSLGALLAVLWEIGEWAGYSFLAPEIGVGYVDTIGDLAAAVAGALVGALAATGPAGGRA